MTKIADGSETQKTTTWQQKQTMTEKSKGGTEAIVKG